MKKTKILMLSILSAFIFFTACDTDDDPEPVVINEAEVLVNYLEDVGGNPMNSYPVMITSTDVNSGVIASADQYIIDIRSAADYAAGHIQGSVNVLDTEVLAHYESNNLQDKGLVVIACYSGQTAGWVTGLLHAAGYTNVKDLKWGMCSWNATTSGSWTSTTNVSNAYATQLVTDATEKAAAGDLPTLSTGETEGTEILKARVEAVFAEGFAEAKTSNATVFGAPDDYYILNYWNETDYSWGHIPGATQYTPAEDLAFDAFLNTLPTDKTIAVYCYTGQTSAHVTAYLRVLGYDAKSILYGVNGMSYDNMPGTKFIAADDIHDYDLVQ